MPLILRQLFKDKVFIRYALSGVIVSLGELTMFAMMIYTWDWGYLWASAIIFFFGLLASFVIRKLWVFSHRGHYHGKQQLFLYAAIFTISTMINLAIMFILVDSLKLPEIVSQLIALFLVGFFTYTANRSITFKPLAMQNLTLTAYIKSQQEASSE